MATVFITGGGGCIGSNLAVAFRKRGERVVTLDNRPATARLDWQPSRTAEDILRHNCDWAVGHADLMALLYGKPA